MADNKILEVLVLDSSTFCGQMNPGEMVAAWNKSVYSSLFQLDSDAIV